MKNLLLIALLYSLAFTPKSLAQKVHPFKTIGKNDSLKIKVIRRLDNKNYYLIRKTKGGNDSLLISKSQTDWHTDTCIIKQKQLNKTGLPEIILEITQANQLETESNSSFTTLQIWDWESKSMLFNGTKKWYSAITFFSDTKLDNNFKPTMVTSVCEGSYDITLTDDGTLIVNNLHQRVLNTDYCNTDHQEGIYMLTEGIYRFKKQ